MRTRGILRAGLTGAALIILFTTGCSTQSSLGDLPARASHDSCPSFQSKICKVAWPTRLKGRELHRTCRCT